MSGGNRIPSWQTAGSAEDWAERLGPADDDLTQVLRHVRVNRLPATRASWANSWQTREFLNLGLMILWEHQVAQGTLSPGEGMRLTSALTPENLANKAQMTISDPDRAAALSVVRWKETWGHQAAYTEDLIAYLFRPQIYERRIIGLESSVISVPPGTSFDSYIRSTIDVIFSSAAQDPMVSLQSWIQAAVPHHPSVTAHARAMQESSRRLWSLLLEKSLGAFGVAPSNGYDFGDVGVVLRTTVAGLLLTHRSDKEQPVMANGDGLMVTAALGVISGLCDVPIAQMSRMFPVGTGTDPGDVTLDLGEVEERARAGSN